MSELKANKFHFFITVIFPIFLVLIFFFYNALPANSRESEKKSKGNKILVLYYSRSGSTKAMAEEIAWRYRPAVPLWTVVDKNDFSRKNVVLFNTFNSRFKDKYINMFKKLMERKGGKIIDHIYVRRGRIFWQKSRKELIKLTHELINVREKNWIGVINK